jgi:hypothetical protein
MPEKSSVLNQPASAIPVDDLRRNLAVAHPDADQKLPHIGVVGDTYTILLTGKDTAGRFGLIDMHIPRVVGHLPTVMTSKRLSPFLRANSRSPSVALSGSYGRVRRSTSPPMRHISFTTHLLSQQDCFASVRRPVRRISSWRSVYRSQPVRRLHPSWMRKHKQSSKRSRRHLLQSIEPSCSNTPEENGESALPESVRS